MCRTKICRSIWRVTVSSLQATSRRDSLRVQELEILLNRQMHALSSVTGARLSLQFYHSRTDTATYANTEEFNSHNLLYAAELFSVKCVIAFQ
jgi:hypothetical protein